jgi:hypothetical protein
VGPKILIVIPVLQRPHRAQPVVNSIRRATPDGAYRVLFVGNLGDNAEHDAVRATGEELLVIGPRRPGDYARKINTAFAQSDEPLLLTGADDLEFHAGWLEVVWRCHSDGWKVIGTQDLGNPRVIRGEHATHIVFDREYVARFGTIDEPGKVFHEGYDHECVDDEAIGTAKMRGVWAFAADAIVEHLHPNWSKAPTDPLYEAQRVRIRSGRMLFNQRRRLWEIPCST